LEFTAVWAERKWKSFTASVKINSLAQVEVHIGTHNELASLLRIQLGQKKNQKKKTWKMKQQSTYSGSSSGQKKKTWKMKQQSWMN
jgi:hypothetical protein